MNFKQISLLLTCVCENKKTLHMPTEDIKKEKAVVSDHVVTDLGHRRLARV